MELVNIRHQENRQHKEQQEMAEDEVASEIAKLGDLAEELATRLRERMPAHVVPFAGPPGDVRRVCAELAGKSQSNDYLVDEALDRHDSDHAAKSLGEDKAFGDEHDLEEDNGDDYSNAVSHRSEHCADLFAAQAEDRTHAACHSEESDGNTCIYSDRSESDDEDA